MVDISRYPRVALLVLLVPFLLAVAEAGLIKRRPLLPLPTITTTPSTTLLGCYVNGRFYAPGTKISEVQDKSSNWCYGSFCTRDGRVQKYDNFNCFPTTVTTTPPPTTTTVTREPIGCHYNGHFYAPGMKISEGVDRASNWCYTTFCSSDGQVQHGDNFNCFPTTVTTTPPPTTTTVTRVPVGCYANGRMYAPGMTISEGVDKASNWCYGSTCGSDGTVLHWDAPNCVSTPPTPVPPTAVPTTTLGGPLDPGKTTTLGPPPTPKRFGCYFDGRFYAAGTIIYQGEDRASNWCYGADCDQHGHVRFADDFNCFPNTGETPTAVPSTSLPGPLDPLIVGK